jgi:hypothetical protein
MRSSFWRVVPDRQVPDSKWSVNAEREMNRLLHLRPGQPDDVSRAVQFGVQVMLEWRRMKLKYRAPPSLGTFSIPMPGTVVVPKPTRSNPMGIASHDPKKLSMTV